MNARTLLRRRRRRIYVGASITLGLIVGTTCWMNLASPESGYFFAAPPSAAYRTASYGVKSERVFSNNVASASPAPEAVAYPMATSSVPEPTSLLLMAPALLLLHRRRRE